MNPQDDADWQTFVVIDIAPNPNLTPSQRESVVEDFGMQDGRLSKTIRRSLVSYFVRHLRIESPQESQPIVWANRAQFKDLMDANDPSQAQTLEGERHV